MAGMLTPTQIADAMRNHVISSPKVKHINVVTEDAIVDVVDTKPAKKSVKKATQLCEFCNKKFVNVKLHSSYCNENPRRRKGNRAFTKEENAYKHIAKSMLEAIDVDIIIHQNDKFDTWIKLTKSLLGLDT